MRQRIESAPLPQMQTQVAAVIEFHISALLKGMQLLLIKALCYFQPYCAIKAQCGNRALARKH
jgi:hypothetical protein